MSNAQYLDHETHGGGGPYVDLHSAETLAYGVYAAPGAYDDTYRPAYEEEPAPLPPPPLPPPPPTPPPSTPATLQLPAPLLPRQGAPVPPGPGRRAARRRRARAAERPDSPLRRLLPRALVVAFLAGGTTAFVAEDKAVELTVDGKERTLHTFADDVTELLAEEGVALGPHDLVAPAPGSALSSGDEVAVHYGRPVRLTLDGQRHQLWTTARTVEAALAQFGVRAEGAHLSLARTRRIGREGLALEVRTERSVTVMADGRARTIRTNAATVREAVEEAGITLRGQDTTSVPPGSFPRDGQTVTVLRITGTKEVRDEPVPFHVRRTDDPFLFRGTEVVEQAGRPGLRRVTYSLRTVNGVRQKPRRVRAEVVRAPRPQVVKVGTKPLPTSVRGADGLDWQGLAACESGGRPDAVDSSGTYGGLYQFDTRTWHSLGGTGRPQDAPAAEQTYRAKKLYVRRGASPWPHCGAHLYR
ncbi:ubiquitin-like domain-containing protein [Streptomyces sp. NPDC001388]|uniref:ubiquitin-like domain-containing protein n=1 Tax=Streptomyces sp. NPDC001388 TaxID=3364568 RepID=UPI0036C169D6